jgi:2-ketoarginine methyltransferase
MLWEPVVNGLDGPADLGPDLRRLLDYTSKWATAELLNGLLQHERLYAGLGDGLDEQAIVAACGLSGRQVRSLMTALEVEGVVKRDGTAYRLTAFGQQLGSLRGWMDLFMRGYGSYYRNAAALWHGTVDPAWRRIRHVGLASVRISEYGALPALERLIAELEPDARVVMDFGCANGQHLVRLCQRSPGLRGVGVEPSADLCREAERLVREQGLEGRVRIVNAPAQDFEPGNDERPDVVVFAFVLQELVEQIGFDALVELLDSLQARHPDAWFLVVEVDPGPRARPQEMARDPYLRGYYNHYYLLHDFTDQRLLGFVEWRELFTKAGLEVHREEAIDPRVDPTGLERVFALRSSGPSVRRPRRGGSWR